MFRHPIKLTFCFLAMGLFGRPESLSAQQLDIPRPSPRASVSQYIGITQVEINYCRPAVKGRKIFGNLVPFEQVWRTGANEATTLAFQYPIFLEGHEVPAGKYALFTIPGAEYWTIIINREWNQWGAYHYHKDMDVVRFRVPRQQTDAVEQLTISFTDITATAAILNINWAHTNIAIHISTDTEKNTISEIEKTTTRLRDNWYVYSAAAQYYFYELKNTSKSMELINMAIALEAPNPSPWMLKSQILASEGKYEAAIRQAELALKVCDAYNFEYEVQENKSQIKKWKPLANDNK